jgi:penicillin amidase
LAGLFLLAALAGAGWFYSRLRASLPRLDGAQRISGLAALVTIERDALGVPTIRATTREDIARSLGYLHAQDRFFQMDLLRRRGAGELAEILGPAVVQADRTARRFGFRALAQGLVARMDARDRAVLGAYAEGVNAGLAGLGAKPFEYYVLRVDPQPWRPEDCVLVEYAMVLNLSLEDSTGRYESSLGTLRDVYGDAAVAFFAPLMTLEDAAVDGTVGVAAPIPGPAVIDLRKEAPPAPRAKTILSGTAAPTADSGEVPGSNSFAVAGGRTATGAGLLANDMHLGLSIPNTWYRASLVWPSHQVTGVSLPGFPGIVAGSNGHIAWGLTVAGTDVSDVIVLSNSAPDLYWVPSAAGGELREIERRHETIRVKGAKPIDAEYDWTIWGPVVGRDPEGHSLVLRWVADEPGAIDPELMKLEDARSVDEAVAVAHRAGLPPQNFLVADSAGHIAWTVAGRIPKRIGYDGRFPVTWHYGDRRWDGFVAPEEVPTVKDPDGSILWTANNRVVGGASLRILGDGFYARPARAAQARDDLRALVRRPGPVGPRDLLAVQLDDRALFLAPWQKLLVDTLTPASVAGKASRGELLALAQKWEGRASIDSVSYWLVASFRERVGHRILDPIFAPCLAADPRFTWGEFHCEDAVWTLLQARPVHMLAPAYRSWSDLLLAAADDVTAEAKQSGVRLRDATWGHRNTLHMAHPFSALLPGWLTGWLNMPAVELPGDNDMPRIQGPAFGASERFAVSPGHEAEGIFEMPGGQSGHPLSPFYRAGHEAWIRGDPTPFMPGQAVHTLVLQP